VSREIRIKNARNDIAYGACIRGTIRGNYERAATSF
jgi:hypothetical protein